MTDSSHRRGAGRNGKHIAEQLGAIDAALPGSITKREMRCGRPGCRCKADPPQLHGPYLLWTRKVDGKTVTRVLTEEQLDRYRGWFDNARKLRQLVFELEAISLLAFEEAEGEGDAKS